MVSLWRGFLSGRYIGENIRIIYDLISYADYKDIPGILLFIDFEKAFDCVSHDFLWNVLHFFNYGDNIIKWIKLLYANSASSVLINGCLTSRFNIKRGCRQGDPLSPYLFLLCAEILGMLVRKSHKIKGIVIEKKEYRISQYADDTVLFLDSRESLHNALELLDIFSKYSGLNINVTKTQILCIGSLKKTVKIDLHHLHGTDISLVNQKFVRYLGIDFCIDLEKLPDFNYDRIFDKLKRQMISWSKRNISVFGRVVLVKSLLVSQFNHLFMSIPNPSEHLLKAINVSFFKFIWKGKPDKISRKQIVCSYENGGLKMVDVVHFSRALKLTWIRRILLNSCEEVTHLMYAFLRPLSSLEWGKGDIYFTKLSVMVRNCFWKELFQILAFFVRHVQCTSLFWQATPIWCNSDIKIGGKGIFLKEWWDKGIRFINDLLDDQGNILVREECEKKFSIKIQFLHYYALCQIIKCKYKSQLESCNLKVTEPLCPAYVSNLLKEKKGCRHIYHIMLKERDDHLNILCNRWYADGVLFDDKYMQYYFRVLFRCTMHTTVRYFQYRLLNRILFLNKDLVKFNITLDKNCSFCGREEEDMVHFFYYCNVTKLIWSRLTDWLYNVTRCRIEFSLIHVLLGFIEKRNDALNCVIIWTKQQLYFARIQKTIPTFITIKQCIRNCYLNERQVSILANKTDKFDKKWLNFDRILMV